MPNATRAGQAKQELEQLSDKQLVARVLARQPDVFRLARETGVNRERLTYARQPGASQFLAPPERARLKALLMELAA